jgi:hypothetical protein
LFAGTTTDDTGGATALTFADPRPPAAFKQTIDAATVGLLAERITQVHGPSRVDTNLLPDDRRAHDNQELVEEAAMALRSSAA